MSDANSKWVQLSLMWTFNAFVGSIVFVCMPTHGQEFRCEDVKATPERGHGYERSASGLHCEGFYEVLVQSPNLELLSLYKPGTPSSKGSLELVTSPKASRIVVQTLMQGFPYRADLAVRDGRARWDSSSMTRATSQPLDQLGFVAFRAGETSKLEAIAVSIGEPPPGAPVTAVIRTAVPTKEISWRVMSGSLGSSAFWEVIPKSQLRQWERIAFRIPPASDARVPRTIEIRAVADDERFFPIQQIHLAADQ